MAFTLVVFCWLLLLLVAAALAERYIPEKVWHKFGKFMRFE